MSSSRGADPVPRRSAPDRGIASTSPDGHDDWDDHWTRYEETARENPAQAYRRRLVFRLIEESGRPERLLDIGSGQGDLLAEAAARWPEAGLAGVELSASGIDHARRKVPGARFAQRDLLADEAPPPDLAGWATSATCSEVLEHVEDPVRFLEHAGEFLAPGCRLVITVPGGPMSAFDRHIGHRIHYTTDTIGEVVRGARLEVDRVLNAGFPFFNLYRRLVILRGEKLIEDVDTSGDGATSLAARVSMRFFDVSFRANRDHHPKGTQLVVVARRPMA